MKNQTSLLKALFLFLLSAAVGMAIMILIVAPYVLSVQHSNPVFLFFYVFYVMGIITFIGSQDD